MNFGKAIADFYTGYVGFKGRTSRSGYWLAVLFYVIVTFAISAVEGQPINPETGMAQNGPAVSIWTLVNLLPSIAIGIRRMHDVSKSGWFLLIPIYNLVLACTPGVAADNKYGPQAK